MVRRWALGGLAALGLAGPALAGPDWHAAGGAIFAEVAAPGPEAPPASAAPAQPAGTPAPFTAAIEAAAARHGLDPKLLRALVVVESGYRPDAISPAGAGGLTQLMPATAQALGVADRFDPDANLLGGADYLARQIARFQDVRLALAAYNAGPARVQRAGGVPPITESRQYVGRVVDCYLALVAGRPVRSAGDCGPVTP